MTFETRQPPRRAHGGTPHTERTPHLADFVAFLDANPNTWAVYHTYQSLNSAAARRRRARRLYTHLGYNFIVRRGPDGYTLYGRKITHSLAHTPAA